MFSKMILVLFLALPACAKPNYQESPSSLLDAAKDLSACTLPLPKINQCVALNWKVKPTDSDRGVLTVTFSESMLNDLSVVLWMPSMGHGSSRQKSLV